MKNIKWFLFKCLILSSVIMITVAASSSDEGVMMSPRKWEIFYNDNKISLVDQEEKPLNTYVHNGVTYVPLRSYSEQIGIEVDWRNDENIYIKDGKENKQKAVEYGNAYLTGPIENVSIINLIANPEEYEDKMVTVKGVIKVEFEADTLFLTREDMNYYNLENGIDLNFRTINNLGVTIEELENISERYVLVQGKFKKTSSDYWLLTDICYIWAYETKVKD